MAEKPPDSIRRAVDMLNDPWAYEETLKHYLPDTEARVYRFSDGIRISDRDDPKLRIRANPEKLEFSSGWVLYVEWDDSEPLNARNLVHRVVRECGLESFVATGCSSNWDSDSEWEQNKKFPVRNAQVSYLKVAPTETAMRYVCDECGEASGEIDTDINLSFSVE